MQQKRRKRLQSFQNSKGKTAQSSIGGNSQEDMQTDENENSDQSFYQEEQEELLVFPDNLKSSMMIILRLLTMKNLKKPLRISELT